LHNIAYLRHIKSGVTWTMISSLHSTLPTTFRYLFPCYKLMKGITPAMIVSAHRSMCGEDTLQHFKQDGIVASQK